MSSAKILKYTSIFLLLLPLFLANAKTIEQIKRENRARIAAIKKQGEISKAKIRAKYQRFLSGLKRVDRSLKLTMPISQRQARNVITHNNAPDRTALPKVHAFVIENYRLMSAASNRSPKTGTRARRGDKVEVILTIRRRSSQINWCLIRMRSGNEGFIPHTHLQNDPSEKITPTVGKGKIFVVNVSDGLRMRDQPSAAGKHITLMPYGAEVRVFRYSKRKDTFGGKRGPWAYLVYNGKKGWAFAPFLKKKGKVSVTAKGFVMPVSGRISSKFGKRIDPITKKLNSYHRGIDIVARRGTPIKAAGAGTIHRASRAGGYGNLTIINHGRNIYTYYAHQSRFKKRKGSRVRAGDVIGLVGTTGRSTGPHLHFEVRKGRKAFNPKSILPQ